MIEVKNLCKTYGNHKAIDNLTFTIGNGHIYGFLGPNGAGKSTTMNIITGCLAPSSGSVSINGFDILENSTDAKRNIGYLPEKPPVFGDMTPLEYLNFIADVKKISKSEKNEKIQAVMEEIGLLEVKDRLIKNLSKGYKQRVGIAQAILGDPEIVILDEPTVGLDPKQIIEIRNLIKSLGENRTVILSSHILSEIQAVCDEILIISGGKLVANDTAENLEKMFEGNATLTIAAKAQMDKINEILSGIEGVLNVKFTAENNGFLQCELTVKDDSVAEDVFFAFADNKVALNKMILNRATLEDVFMELTNEDIKPTDAQDSADTEAENEPEENMPGENAPEKDLPEEEEADKE